MSGNSCTLIWCQALPNFEVHGKFRFSNISYDRFKAGLSTVCASLQPISTLQASAGAAYASSQDASSQARAASVQAGADGRYATINGHAIDPYVILSF